MIFEAAVGKARDTVVLKLTGPDPAERPLWYGYGLDPYCNLTDGLEWPCPSSARSRSTRVLGSEPPRAPVAADSRCQACVDRAATPEPARARQPGDPIKVLIITGDNPAHDWKATTPALKEILEPDGQIKVDVTTTPAKDLTDENLAKYDVLLLNYKDTPNGPPETKWSDANKEAFLKAVSDGKGLVVYHFASAAFTKPNWDEFEKAIAGGWRTQGYHGPKHDFTVKKTAVKHPISDGLPAEFDHTIDELYQNSMLTPGQRRSGDGLFRPRASPRAPARMSR